MARRAHATARRRLALTALVAGLVLLGASCSDLAAPYVARDRGDRPTPQRLTYSAGNRAPAWLHNDTIVYAARSYPPFPSWAAMPMLLPRDSGAVAPIFPDALDLGTSISLLTPVPDPSGERVAYVRRDDYSGGGPAIGPGLSTARLFVRAREAGRPLQDDPAVAIAFSGGATFDPSIQIPGLEYVARYRVRQYPFQVRFAAGLALPFRPSWSPDGARLVYSDGLRLLTWAPGDTAPVALAGGERGFSAAWSPRGDYIAFTRPVVLDSTTTDTVTYARTGAPEAVYRITTYREAVAHVLLLPAAGGTPRDLGEGEEPAWAPDGSSLYVAREDGTIARLPVSGGAAVPVPGVDSVQAGASSSLKDRWKTAPQDPAVSPDGHWLVFTRGNDLWLLALTP